MNRAERIRSRRQEGKTYFGIPSGSLQGHTIKLLMAAQLLAADPERKYEVTSTMDDVMFRILDRKDMGRLIMLGIVDAGITGKDYLRETRTHDKVEPISDFIYSKVLREPTKLVLASDHSVCRTIEECRGAVIATELPLLTEEMLQERYGFSPEDTRNISPTNGKTETNVMFGATEVMSEITETGKTLKENGMTILATLFQSNPQLVANRDALRNPQIVERINELATRFNVALLGEVIPSTILSFNIPASYREQALALLPNCKTADIVPTVDKGTCAISVHVPCACIEALKYQLLKLGADKIFDPESGLTMSQNMRVRCPSPR